MATNIVNKKFVAKEILIFFGVGIIWFIVLLCISFEQDYWDKKVKDIDVESQKVDERVEKIDSLLTPQDSLPHFDLSSDGEQKESSSTKLPDINLEEVSKRLRIPLELELERDSLHLKEQQLNINKSKFESNILKRENLGNLPKTIFYLLLFFVYVLRPIYYILKWAIITVKSE